MSLAFRFKAGGSGTHTTMAPTNSSVHHHRSTTKVDHKPYKTRFASKGALKDQAKGMGMPAHWLEASLMVDRQS